MAGENVVSILVKADNATGAGFGEATASAEEMAEKVNAAMSDYIDAVEKAEEANARLAELQQDDAATADDLAAAQDRVTQATLASVDAQMRLVEAERAEAVSAAESGDAQEELGAKSEVSAGGMAGLWSKAQLALLGVGAAMIYGTVKAAGFESQLLTLHTQAGVASDQLKSLGNGVLALAGQVGDSPDSLVEALYHVESSFASVGIKGPQALNLLKIAAEGAAVGHANLTDVTNALDATIVAGVPGITSYSQAMGALNAIVGSGDMTMQDLADAMGTGVMAVAKSFGQNIYQVGAALATLGDNNIRGAKAATDLRMAWQAMQAPLTTAKPVLESIGLTMTQLGHTMTHEGMSAAIEQFIDHLKASKVPVSDWGQMMTEIFGKKAGVGIGILVDQLGRLQSKFPDLEKGASGFGQAWKDQSQTVAQQWKNLTAGMEALVTKLGEAFLPMAMKAVRVLSDMANFLTRNQWAAYALAAVLGGSLAAIIGGKLIESAAGAAEAFRSLGESELLAGAASKVAAAGQFLLDAAMDANPIMLVVLAIAALVAGFILAYQHITVFRDAIKDVFKAIEDAVSDVVDFVAGHWKLLIAIILGPLGLIIDALATHWSAVEDGFKKCWNAVKDVFVAVWGFIRPFVMMEVDAIKLELSWFEKLAGLFREWWDAAANAVHSEIDKLIGFVETIPGRINSALSGLPGMMFRAGVHVIESLISGITSMIGSVVSTVGHIAGKIAGFFGLSPAIEGPLSGGGAPEIRGQHFAADIARGMLSGLPGVSSAASRVAGAAGIGPSGAGSGSGAGGSMTLQFSMGSGGSGLDAMFWTWFKNGIRAQGGDPKIVNRKVAFV